MADQSIKMTRLQAILKRYGVEEVKRRGKGSHLMFSKTFPEGTFTYPVPTHDQDVKVCYIKGCRKKFRLRVEDGVTDKEFYGK
jgi:predicted RNA binding protein YcfA (HicA-like mRNA interferase family)